MKITFKKIKFFLFFLIRFFFVELFIFDGLVCNSVFSKVIRFVAFKTFLEFFNFHLFMVVLELF